MKTLIAIPTYHYTETLFDQSLDRLKPVGSINIVRLPGSLVDVARNRLIATAIEEKADYILWIDSDMVFEPDVLEKLMKDIQEHDCDVVSSICFVKQAPFRPVIYSKIRLGAGTDENIAEEYLDYPKDSLFEVDACGFGCVLMKTSVAETMLGAAYPCFSRIKGFGEDISFCVRAKQLGFKIYCDSRVKVGHITRAVVDENTYLAYRADHKE